MKNILLFLGIGIILISCSKPDNIGESSIVYPKDLDKSLMYLEDDSIQSQYVLTNKNYIQKYNDVGQSLKDINNADMILSSILNFNRLSTNDRYGILQPDRIFSNLIDLKYLELPVNKSKVKLGLLELIGDVDGKKTVKNVKLIEKENNELFVTYPPLQVEKDTAILDEDESLLSQKKPVASTIKNSLKGDYSSLYHDRSMLSIFAKSESGLIGFTTISKKENLQLEYVNQKSSDQTSNIKKNTYTQTQKGISNFMKKNIDIVSMSTDLFDNPNDVNEFLNEISTTPNEFQDCIINNNCNNPKFTWVVALGNIELEADKNKTINPKNYYNKFKHTKFITVVTSSMNVNQQTILFEPKGKQFSDIKGQLDYFSINLPEKVLVAYEKNKLKFNEASTSYATAVFSAVLYNLYSLDPLLDEDRATQILKSTSYNKQCINNDKMIPMYGTHQTKLDCKEHKPSKIGYIVNMKEAYNEVIRQLIETHNYSYFTNGDIKNSLYTEDSVIQKTSVIDENTYIVKKIKMREKRKDTMKLGTVFIDNLNIKFSKNNIICRYEQSFNANDNSYNDTTYKELTLEYDDSTGKPFILEERNLRSYLN